MILDTVYRCNLFNNSNIKKVDKELYEIRECAAEVKLITIAIRLLYI